MCKFLWVPTQEPEDTKERNNAIGVSENSYERKNYSQNCSIPTQELEDAKESNNVICMSENAGKDNVQILSIE